MRTISKPKALARSALGAAALAAGLVRCDPSAYPIEPTFCDDWCRVLLRTDCDQEPENCVRDCERSIAPEPCFSLQVTLLECYRKTPASEFVCSDEGFQSPARPEEWVCQAERDALIECAYPEVKACLDVCRAAEASFATDASVLPGSQTRCPSSNVPCDSICWTARHYLGEHLDASSALGTLSPALMECAIERATQCQNGEADAGAQNWSSVFLACAEALGG